MSVNGKELMKLDVQSAEKLLKSVPKGTVKIIAMAPPKDYLKVSDFPKQSMKTKGRDEEEGVVTVEVS